MTKPPASLYTVAHSDTRSTLVSSIDKGINNAQKRPQLFFRADDIGVPSRSFHQLVECFQKHTLPLCLATVPTWLTLKRFNELSQYMQPGSSQWYWHQHGWLHRNFELSGKKQEFGPSRHPDAIKEILNKGRIRLEKILGSYFNPVFTPPWNRCNQATLTSLIDLRFQAISRSSGARPKTLSTLPDFQVNVDLHTRKEHSHKRAMTNVLTELEQAIASGQCGIMIHHQRMNKRAFDFLDLLLEVLSQDNRLDSIHFGDLIPKSCTQNTRKIILSRQIN
jgi:hypothetical protein